MDLVPPLDGDFSFSLFSGAVFEVGVLLNAEEKMVGYLSKSCPTRGMCTENAKCEKTVLRHVWQDYVEMAEHVRHMAVYKELYRLRKEKIERVFADAKEKHGMRYTQYCPLPAKIDRKKVKKTE